MFALVDANNMYVSCERVFQPRLNGEPVVVLSSNDGACIARSNEAKELGVKMAQPWFQVRHLERSAGLIAVSANFELYSDMSSRMMAVEARYAPRQEVYSIDESFLSFDGVRADLVAIGKALRASVLQETGLPTRGLWGDEDFGQAGQPCRQDGRPQAGLICEPSCTGVQFRPDESTGTGQRHEHDPGRRRVGSRQENQCQVE
jgi:hypothetical protein